MTVRERGSPAAKSRPCIIVQHSDTLEGPPKITVCPLTSRLQGASGARPLAVPTPENGLRVACEAQYDWIYTHPIGSIGKRIGTIEIDVLNRIDDALRRWLDL